MPVRYLHWQDPLEEEMVIHSSILEPMDRGAWQATVYGVAKTQTQLSAHTHTNTHTQNYGSFLQQPKHTQTRGNVKMLRVKGMRVPQKTKTGG